MSVAEIVEALEAIQRSLAGALDRPPSPVAAAYLLGQLVGRLKGPEGPSAPEAS